MASLKAIITRKQSTPNFLKNKHFLPLDTHTHAYQGDKKCSFFGKFGVLCFLVTSIDPFALLPAICPTSVRISFPQKDHLSWSSQNHQILRNYCLGCYRLGIRDSDKACAVFREKYAKARRGFRVLESFLRLALVSKRFQQTFHRTSSISNYA